MRELEGTYGYREFIYRSRYGWSHPRGVHGARLHEHRKNGGIQEPGEAASEKIERTLGSEDEY